MKASLLKGISMASLCLLVLTGCAPGIQTTSVGSTSATNVVQANVNWNSLEQAVKKSAQSTLYRIKSDVSLQNGSLHTNYSVYGTVQLPDRASIQVHENSFNISLYQQGQVAYADEKNAWTKTSPIVNYDAFAGYQQVVQSALKNHLSLQQLNRTYVVDEYCDVYRFTLPSSAAPVSDFLQGNSVTNAQSQTLGESIQYTMYIGQTTGYLRQIETQSINTVDQMGPIETKTTTTFFDIDDPQVAQVQIPPTLVTHLESK